MCNNLDIKELNALLDLLHLADHISCSNIKQCAFVPVDPENITMGWDAPT